MDTAWPTIRFRPVTAASGKLTGFFGSCRGKAHGGCRYLSDMGTDAPSIIQSKPVASRFAAAPLIGRQAGRFVDEEAVTLQLRPLRWRDRVLPDVLRWTGAGATVAAVAGGCLFFAAPSEAARIDPRAAGAEPMMTQMTQVAPMLAEARVDADPEMKEVGGAIEGEDEDVIIIIDEEEDDEEILIFDDSLDAPSAAAMAEAHLARNEHGLGLQYALEATEADPENAAHQMLLGKAYRLTGDRRASRKAMRRARRLRR